MSDRCSLGYLFHKLNVNIFRALSITMWMDRGYLVRATPPTFLFRFFWNLTGVGVMVWRYACGLDIILSLFLSLFSQVEHSHFWGNIYNNVNRHGIPCGRNSSYNFILILLKLHWCFGHGLKICMCYGYNPQIIFCTLFHKLNLPIFRALSITKWMDRWYLVGVTPTIL